MNIESLLSAVYGLMNQCLDRRAIAAHEGKPDVVKAYGWMADQLASYLRLSPRTKKPDETHPILVQAGSILFEQRVRELRAGGMDDIVRATGDDSWLLRQHLVEEQVAQVLE